MSTADLMTTDPATGLTGQDRRRAAVVACGYVETVEEAREVLEALGLLEDLQTARRLAG
jgi:hypothetical protein